MLQNCGAARHMAILEVSNVFTFQGAFRSNLAIQINLAYEQFLHIFREIDKKNYMKNTFFLITTPFKKNKHNSNSKHFYTNALAYEHSQNWLPPANPSQGGQYSSITPVVEGVPQTFVSLHLGGTHTFTGLEHSRPSDKGHTSFPVVQFIGLQYSVLPLQERKWSYLLNTTIKGGNLLFQVQSQWCDHNGEITITRLQLSLVIRSNLPRMQCISVIIWSGL